MPAGRSRTEQPGTPVVMLTSYADEEALFDAIAAGASGYVLKRIGSDELVSAIRTVAQGQSMLDPAVTAAVLDRLRRAAHAEESGAFSELTEQERRVLAHLAQGESNREIADAMELAEKTVRNYVSNILAKLSLASRVPRPPPSPSAPPDRAEQSAACLTRRRAVAVASAARWWRAAGCLSAPRRARARHPPLRPAVDHADDLRTPPPPRRARRLSRRPTPEPPLSLALPDRTRTIAQVAVRVDPNVPSNGDGEIVVMVTNLTDRARRRAGPALATELRPALFLAPFRPSEQRIRGRRAAAGPGLDEVGPRPGRERRAGWHHLAGLGPAAAGRRRSPSRSW